MLQTTHSDDPNVQEKIDKLAKRDRKTEQFFRWALKIMEWIIAGITLIALVGALGIMTLVALLILRGYRIALNAPDRFSTVLSAGLVTLIAVQTLLNFGVVTNLLPSTGVALPFFSYGGTALAVNLGEMGIVLAVSRGRYRPKRQERRFGLPDQQEESV